MDKELLACDDCCPGRLVGCRKWPSGRGMTVIVKNEKQNEKARVWARSEGLVCIAVFPAHVVVHLERSAGLRLTDAGAVQ